MKGRLWDREEIEDGVVIKIALRCDNDYPILLNGDDSKLCFLC